MRTDQSVVFFTTDLPCVYEEIEGILLWGIMFAGSLDNKPFYRLAATLPRVFCHLRQALVAKKMQKKMTTEIVVFLN